MDKAPMITIPVVMSMMRLVQLKDEVDSGWWREAHFNTLAHEVASGPETVKSWVEILSEYHSRQHRKAEMKLEDLQREFNPSEVTEGLWALHENTVTYVRAEHLEGYLAFTMNGNEVKTVESSELVYAWKVKGKIKLVTVPPRMGVDRYYRLKKSLERIQGGSGEVA